MAKKTVAPVIDGLFKDQVLAVDILYKMFLGKGEYDDVLGYQPTLTQDISTRMLKLRHTKESVAASSNSEVEIGDMNILLQYSADLMNAGSKDLIEVVATGDKYKVFHVDFIFDLLISVTVKGDFT
jgi:hypothetical protein